MLKRKTIWSCLFHGALAIVVVMLLGLASSARAEQRVALVIGNAAYSHTTALPNTANDANDIAASLQRLGFDVTLHLDLKGFAMQQALHGFSRRARNADMALIYFAGHGIEVGKRNYLIPTDAQLRTNADVNFEAISLDLVMAAVGNAKGLRLVLLDACRTNPFASTMQIARRFRAVGRGFSRVEPEAGTLVGYAAREGTTADDGEGRNSPYAKALLAHLEQPGLELNLLFRKVRDQVLRETKGAQEPFTYGSLPGKRIYLKAPLPAKPKVSEAELRERGAWNFVRESRSLAMLRNYVGRFPNGRFRPKADALILELEAEAKHKAERLAKRQAEENRRKEAEAKRQAKAKSEAEALARQLARERADRQAKAEARRKAAEARAAAEALAKRLAQEEAIRREKQLAEARRKAELADWQAVSTSTDPAEIEGYLARRPDGTFSDLARARLKALRQQVRLAALPPQPEPAQPAPATADQTEKSLDRGALVHAVQKQLNRLGCDAGRPDGKWGRGSRRALEAFARHGRAKLASLDPTPETLKALTTRKARVCPLKCGPRQEASGDRCVLKKCGRGKELNRKGTCVAKLDDQVKKKQLNCSPRHRVRGNRCVLKRCGKGKSLDKAGNCIAARDSRKEVKAVKRAKQRCGKCSLWGAPNSNLGQLRTYCGKRYENALKSGIYCQ